MTLSRTSPGSQPQQPSPATPKTCPQTTPQTEYSTMAPLPGMRRINSLGPLRRAHPASGATWNVEVIRGKMTSRCLWHACRALVLGIILMVVGGGMATIGYYAVPLSTGQVEKGNSTAFIKNISRGYHLNNLSYIGPIVMGFGGFIVVAACVMTFEARDSAAKVVPARFKMLASDGSGAGGGSGRARNSSAIRRAATGAPSGGGPPSVGSQTNTTRWDRDTSVARDSAAGGGGGAAFRASPADKYPDRQALTAALIHFSRALGTPGHSPSTSRRSSRVSRSGSVPNLHESNGILQSPNRNCFLSKGAIAFRQQQHVQHHQHHNYHQSSHSSAHRNNSSSTGHHRRSGRSRHSSLTKRSTRETASYHNADRFLHPGMLKYHRQAVSVDESHPPILRPILSNSGRHNILGSQPTIGSNTSPTHDVLRMIKRSDTAKQHVLARQRNIENEDNHRQHHSTHSPKATPTHNRGRRRSSTASDVSMVASASTRRASTVSRTSVDSRGVVQRGEASGEGMAAVPSDVNTARGIPSTSAKSWRVSAQISTPSVEKEFRSQLSICSEPANSPKALSCQSSIEPCVPEEEDSSTGEQTNKGMDEGTPTIKQRPDTLILECPLTGPVPEAVHSKYLHEAKKSSSVKRRQPARKAVQKNASVAEIYFISTAEEQNKDYDSIEVIDERRNKSFGQTMGSSSTIAMEGTGGKDSNTNLERTDTVIYRDTVSRTSGKEARESDATKMTIMAEVEQRRSSNVSDTDTADVR